MFYAGLDIGTSSCKIVVYDASGKVRFKSVRTYQETGVDGYRELNTEDVLLKVKEVLKETGEQFLEDISGMAITALGESIICLDEHGKSLYPSMVTGDKRGIAELRELEKTTAMESHAFKEEILSITGLPPSEMYGLPKYMWLNQNTNAIRDAKYIFFFEDYFGYILTGKRMVSYSSASRSMAFNIHEKRWSKRLLSFAGIKKEQMSVPVDSGTVLGTILPELAKECKLNPNLKIVVGGHDQNCAALGSGLSRQDVGECGMGTCEFMFLMLPKAEHSPYMIEHDLTCVPYVIPDTYLTSLEVTTCGILKNWARDTIFEHKKIEYEEKNLDFYNDYMDPLIAGMKTDVLLLPQFGSSGNPDINYDVKGTITGLTLDTKPEEIYRAILEGMAFQMLLSYEKALKLGVKMNRLIATGGGAASDLTLQIRADIFNMEVATITSEESGTLGCMLLAATAFGAFSSLQEAMDQVVKVKKVFYPNQEMHGYYMRKFDKYKKLYEVMHLFQ